MIQPTAVGVMARAPSAPGKTRLAPHLPESQLVDLRTALFLDTLHLVSAAAEFDRVVFFTPADAGRELTQLVGDGGALVAQRGDNLGARMEHAFAELLDRRGYASAILIGTDVPLATPDDLGDARDRLRVADVVIGPAEDGGYYLIGAKRVWRELFDGVTWGSAAVLGETLRAAARAAIEVALGSSRYDVDTIDDLDRVARDLERLPTSVAPRLRAWLSATRA